MIYITRGKAKIQDGVLRCANNQPNWTCNKLIGHKNPLGQIAGAFKCEWCSQIIEISIKSEQPRNFVLDTARGLFAFVMRKAAAIKNLPATQRKCRRCNERPEEEYGLCSECADDQAFAEGFSR